MTRANSKDLQVTRNEAEIQLARIRTTLNEQLERHREEVISWVRDVQELQSIEQSAPILRNIHMYRTFMNELDIVLPSDETPMPKTNEKLSLIKVTCLYRIKRFIMKLDAAKVYIQAANLADLEPVIRTIQKLNMLEIE